MGKIKTKDLLTKSKNYANKLNKAASDLEDGNENPCSLIRHMLESILPYLLRFRSEGKDLARLEKLKKKENKSSKEEDSGSSNNVDEKKLDNLVGKLERKTPFSVYDKKICKDGLLKVASSLKEEDIDTDQGGTYIKKIPQGSVWKNTYDICGTKDINFENLLSNLEKISTETNKYLKSKHINFLKKVKARKLIMEALKRFIERQITLVKELIKNQNSEQLQKILNDSGSTDEEKLRNFLNGLQICDNIARFKDILKQLLSLNFNIADMIAYIDKWSVPDKSNFKAFPCIGDDKNQNICTLARIYMYKNRTEGNIKTFLEDTTKYINDTETGIKSSYVFIENQKHTVWADETCTVGDALQLGAQKLKCKDYTKMFAYIKVLKNFGRIGSGNVILIQPGMAINYKKLTFGWKTLQKIAGSFLNKKIIEYVDQGEIHVFKSEQKSFGDAVKDLTPDKTPGKPSTGKPGKTPGKPSTGTPSPGSSDKKSGNSSTGNSSTGNSSTGKPSTGNSSTGKPSTGKSSTGSSDTNTEQPGDESLNSSSGDGKANNENAIKEKNDKLQKNENAIKDKQKKLNNNLKQIETKEAKIQNNLNRLSKDASSASWPALRWRRINNKDEKTAGLKDWLDHFSTMDPNGNDGFAASGKTAGYRFDEIEKEIKKLQNENKSLQKEVDDMKNENTSLQSEISSLEQTSEILKMDINQLNNKNLTSSRRGGMNRRPPSILNASK